MSVCVCVVTDCATGVGSTMEQRAGHPDDLRLHLSDARKDVWVQRVAPSKISINLNNKGTEEQSRM